MIRASLETPTKFEHTSSKKFPFINVGGFSRRVIDFDWGEFSEIYPVNVNKNFKYRVFQISFRKMNNDDNSFLIYIKNYCLLK